MLIKSKTRLMANLYALGRQSELLIECRLALILNAYTLFKTPVRPSVQSVRPSVYPFAHSHDHGICWSLILFRISCTYQKWTCAPDTIGLSAIEHLNTFIWIILLFAQCSMWFYKVNEERYYEQIFSQLTGLSMRGSMLLFSNVLRPSASKHGLRW